MKFAVLIASLLQEEAEKELWSAWQEIRIEILGAIEIHDYDYGFEALGSLAEPVEPFLMK